MMQKFVIPGPGDPMRSSFWPLWAVGHACCADIHADKPCPYINLNLKTMMELKLFFKKSLKEKKTLADVSE